VNVARFLQVDPEEALSRTVDKFIHRFRKMEEMASARGLDLEQLNLAELDKLWDEAKKEEK